LLGDEACHIFVLFLCEALYNLCPGVVGDRAGFAVVVRLVLLPVVVLEKVLGDLVDPLPVGQAELVADVVLVEEAALVEQLPEEVALEALAGQVAVEDRFVKRGGLLEAGVLRVGKVQSNEQV
jgi:hypothetical protein